MSDETRMTTLVCLNCGAPLERLDSKHWRCTLCKTTFVLDQNAVGDDFYYEQIVKEKIEAGKIGTKLSQIPVNSIIVKEIRMSDKAEEDAIKDSLDLPKNEIVSVVSSYVENGDFEKASQTIGNYLSKDGAIGELYFYSFLASKKAKNIKEAFNYPVSSDDQKTIEEAFENSSPAFMNTMIDQFTSSSFVDDESTLRVYETIFPYLKNERVRSTAEAEAVLDKCFGQVTAARFERSFAYLLRAITKEDVDKYIERNIAFAGKCQSDRAQFYIKNVLSVDSGNSEAIKMLFDAEVSSRDMSAGDAFQTFKTMMSFSKSPNAELAGTLDFMIDLSALSGSHVDLFKRILGCYSGSLEDLLDRIVDFGFSLLRHGLFKEATEIFLIALSIDKKDKKIYWGLCLASIDAWDDQSAIESKKNLQDSPYFNKYLALCQETDPAEAQRLLGLSSSQITGQKDKSEKKQRKKKRAVLIALISLASVGIVIGATLGIVSAVKNAEASKQKAHSLDNLSLVVSGKGEASKTSVYINGIIFGMSLKLSNNGTLGIGSVDGNLKIDTSSPTYQIVYRVTLEAYRSEIQPQNYATFSIDFDNEPSDAAQAVKDANLTKLRISWKYTSISYTDGYDNWDYSSSDYSVIKAYGSGGS